jgi:UDPglucose 6-dehydrogenase
MPVGIIGLGVVGGAMHRGFTAAGCNVLGYDTDPTRSRTPLDETLMQEIVLISVPTPVDAAQRCDLSAIHAVLERAAALGAGGSLVLRSTVPVGTTDTLLEKYPTLKIGFSPEFLRAGTADFDFLNPPAMIYGGADPGPYFAAMDLVCKTHDSQKITLTPREAEMVKLFLNGFAALKAVFSSEMARFAKSAGADWEKVVAAALPDGRLGKGYLSATGPDGLPGVGGHCLPKDCMMLIGQLGEGCVLETVLKVNEQLRQAH